MHLNSLSNVSWLEDRITRVSKLFKTANLDCLKDPIQKNDSIVYEFETAALNKLNKYFFQTQRQIGCMSDVWRLIPTNKN